MDQVLRVAAYAVCVQDGRILLARWVDRASGTKRWTLPGGGMEHGEDPLDTVVREVQEETGHLSRMTALLGVDSVRRRDPRAFGRHVDHHALRIVYEGRIVGGTLRPEVHGSTDLAAWHDVDAVPALDRVPLVDVGLRLWRERPPVGHVAAGTA